jgi:Gpi18-like mannosyltransferase
MNMTRLLLAAFAAFVAYFILGGLFFAAGPLRNEFAKFPTVYRTQESMKPTLPLGMASMLVAMIVLAVLYAMLYKGGSGLYEGARFGALIGLFCVCSFVIHNYVNLNISLRLTLGQAAAYFVEWVVVGVVIGLIYKPTGS